MGSLGWCCPSLGTLTAPQMSPARGQTVPPSGMGMEAGWGPGDGVDQLVALPPQPRAGPPVAPSPPAMPSLVWLSPGLPWPRSTSPAQQLQEQTAPLGAHESWRGAPSSCWGHLQDQRAGRGQDDQEQRCSPSPGEGAWYPWAVVLEGGCVLRARGQWAQGRHSRASPTSVSGTVEFPILPSC